ncbi:MAG: lipoprotein insertase outer membrane protein LolB, partial [Curvibacter sp.]
MKPQRRHLLAALGSLAVLGLAGCAQPARRPAAGTGYWRGRLALRVEDRAEPTAFFANFELSGAADAGELLLSSPIGTILAQLQWGPRMALLRSNGRTRSFDSLDALAIEATGTDIPIAALFAWLQGRAASADGWQADL